MASQSLSEQLPTERHIKPAIHSSSMKGRSHSIEEWEAVRPIIQHLYIDENKSGKRVRETLRIERGFFATRRQFTRRISDWGMKKNIKDTEKRECAHRLSRGEYDEADRVLVPKILRWQKRRGRKEDIRLSPSRLAAISPLDNQLASSAGNRIPRGPQEDSNAASIGPTSTPPLEVVRSSQNFGGREGQIQRRSTTIDVAGASQLSYLLDTLQAVHVNEKFLSSLFPPAREISAFPKSSSNERGCIWTFGIAPQKSPFLQTHLTEDDVESGVKKLQTIWGPEGCETLKAKDILATKYWGGCKYQRAEVLYTEVAESREQTLGLGHVDTLSMYLKVVKAIIFRGGYQEAQKIHSNIHLTILGLVEPENELALESTGLMADILYYLEKDEEAGKLRQQVLQIRLREQGLKSLQTLIAMRKVACILTARDELEESEKLLQGIVQLHHAVNDITEEAIFHDVRELADVMRHQKRYKESEMLFRQVAERSKTSLGPDHVETLSSYSGIAYCLSSQGLTEESERFFRTILDQQLRVLGDRDPDTVATMHELANILERTQRHQEAVPLREVIFDGASEKYGMSHPRTVFRCLELGTCYEALGRPDDALSLYHQLSDQLRELEEAEQPMLAEVSGWIADLQHLLARGQSDDQLQEHIGAQEDAYADDCAIEEEDADEESSTEIEEVTGAGSF